MRRRLNLKIDGMGKLRTDWSTSNALIFFLNFSFMVEGIDRLSKFCRDVAQFSTF